MATSDDPRRRPGADPAGTETRSTETRGTGVTEQLGALKEGLTGYARDKADAVRERTTGLVEEQKDAAAGQLDDMSGVLRETADHLRQRSQRMIADLTQTAAERIEAFAAQLRERDLAGLVADAQGFARRYPALFFVAAGVVGFALGRAIKGATAGPTLPRGQRPDPTLRRPKQPVSPSVALHYGKTTQSYHGSPPGGATQLGDA